MNFHNINDSIEIYECTIEIKRVHGSQTSRIQAPRMMIEQEFISLAQAISQTNEPVMIRLSREVPVYDQFYKRWINNENSIELKNKQYLDMEKI